MQVLTRESLPLGGFAGLTEHRLVTDSRVFAGRKSPNTFEGIGNFVYLADAQFNPMGETHMHPHKEIDVITIMMDGRISHEGSLEHGQSLIAGEAQVQRAGGEGFEHNEVNPDITKNRLLQLWVLPDELGEPAGFKHYTVQQGVTRIYGGSKKQTDSFYSKTTIDIVRLRAGEVFTSNNDVLVYVSKGNARLMDDNAYYDASEGSVVRAEGLHIEAKNDVEVVVVTVTAP
ncbi:pirin family protein [Pseudoalteromonas sp. MMG013]|uniref:pirin family protein n=1 Tax=Pseudoalteromonas sp. MMG013 TaxID=2822687 RepID=UPI001B368D19|nr:pirin family protein [Pseudoalteromonas sp. MMG013]MBQ4861587.1 pirin family protein [Pseudoalteromonas sp. MMG013]